jgi:hypothetical protein
MIGTTARSLFIVAIVSLAMASLASINAKADILDFTFESDTVGSMPAGWSAGGYDGNTVTAYVTDNYCWYGHKEFLHE